MEILSYIVDLVWGPPLIIFLVGTGLWLTIRLKFIQLRFLLYGFKLMTGKQKEEDDNHNEKPVSGDISSFQALATALSATIGTGNIVGVASAILIAGPGAIFWMWVSAVFGMATKYGEALLAVKYREETATGFSGGPMYYLKNGLNMKRLAATFSFLTLVAALGIGNMVQINSAAGSLEASALAIPREVTTAIVALLIALVIFGGIARIGKVAATMVPFMALLYVIFSLAILLMNFEYIGLVFEDIITYAFSPLPMVAGTFSAIMISTIRTGMQRGLFSNEAGLGSAPIAAASARVNYPVKQALVAMVGPFLDTLIICTMTGFVILIGMKSASYEILKYAVDAKQAVPGLGEGLVNFQQQFIDASDVNEWSAYFLAFADQGRELKDSFTAIVFGHFLGPVGQIVVSVALALFSITTILGWYFYGDRSLVYLSDGKYQNQYRAVYLAALVIGGLVPNAALIWKISDIANGLMAVPNLIALALLSGVIVKETNYYFSKYPHRYDTFIRIYVFFLSVLPKNTLSKLMGLLAGLRLPRFVMIPILLAFARIYKINVREAELEVKDYSSLNNFFTRALKNGARIIDDSNQVLVSPVDGTVLTFGSLEEGRLLQSKGRESSLKEMLGSTRYYERFLGGSFVTLYLSPQDYHRIHTPVEGDIVSYHYQPGKLFPVNQIAVNTINRLFSRNERLMTFIENEHGLTAVIKVGATSVGKIRVTYDQDLKTNGWLRNTREYEYEKPIHMAKGQELGRFEMGSTVMLLFEKDMVELLELEEKQKVKVGQPIALYKALKNDN